LNTGTFEEELAENGLEFNMGSCRSGHHGSSVLIEIGARPRYLLRTWSLLRILTLFAISLLTPSMPAIAGQTLTQMYHSRWLVRDGVPRDIHAIAQASDGFLWLATDDGLYRFDGQSFDRYEPASGDPFPGTQFTAIAATSDGGLWLGYGRVGVSFLKGGRNTNYGERAGFGLASIDSFALGKDGTVWAQVGDESTLRIFQGSVWTTLDKDWRYPARSPTNMIFMDASGTLWVATQSGLLYLRSGEHAFRAAPDVTGSVTSIVQTPDGTIWLGSPDAPVRALDPSSALLRQDIPPIDIGAMAIVGHDGSRLFFGGSLDGLARVEWPDRTMSPGGAMGERMEHFSSKDGLTSDRVVMAIVDREGSIWVLTAKGLDQFRPSALTSIDTPRNTYVSTATAVAGDRQIFIGADTLEVPTGRLLRPAPTAVFAITSIYRDDENTLWFGGRSGLWRISGEKFVSQTLPRELSSAQKTAMAGPHIQAMQMDRAGGLLVSISRHGLYRLFGNTWSKMTNLRAAPDNLNTTMTLDSRGRIWFGFARSNLVQVLDGDVVTTFDAGNGIDIGYTTAISEIGGVMVIGGESGIEVLKEGRFRRLRLAGDAPLSIVTGVLQQKNGDLWINQASGIIKINAAEIQNALLNPDLPMRFTLFDEPDGVDEMSRPPCSPSIVDAGNGVLYFSMPSSVLLIDTSRMTRNLVAPTVIIRSLSAGAADYTNSTDPLLPPNPDKVTIRFAASSLLIPQRVQFRYRLEGIDEAWQSGNERFALYSRLPPGHYTFHVTASNNDGIWSKEEAAVRFTIPPSFVQSAGFKTLCAAAAFGMLWLGYRIRLRRMTAQVRRRLYERLEERTRIARNLHDTFFQGIQGLLLRFNTGTALLRRDEPARAIFEQALEQSDRVMLEGRELMLDLREGSGNAMGLAEALVLAGNELKGIYPGDFRVTVNGEPLPLHPVVFDEVHRLGREAITNAFRHSLAKNIEAELHYERGQFRIRVRDDGIGIAAEIMNPGFRTGHWGLPGMRERATKLGGHLDIWSRPGAGTEIELRVPAAAAYVPRRTRRRLSWLRAVTSDSEGADE
jgi:signal transduction histidine kinase/ligand-binding sensor domain-containing protein